MTQLIIFTESIINTQQTAQKPLIGKVYKDYLLQSAETNKKIIAKYGAPVGSKVPTPTPHKSLI